MGSGNGRPPRVNLRARVLTGLEEKVLRMRHGLRGYAYTPLETARGPDEAAALTLARLEDEVRRRAGGRHRH